MSQVCVAVYLFIICIATAIEALSTPYLSATLPTHIKPEHNNIRSHWKHDLPLPLFEEATTPFAIRKSWIKSTKTVDHLKEGTISTARSQCKEYKEQIFEEDLQVELIQKLVDHILDVKHKIEDSRYNKPSDKLLSVSKAFALRELIICLFRNFDKVIKNTQASDTLSMTILLRMSTDVTIAVAMLEKGFASIEALHIISSHFNTYVLKLVKFLTNTLTFDTQSRSYQSVDTYRQWISEWQGGVPHVPMSYETYNFLTTAESLVGKKISANKYRALYFISIPVVRFGISSFMNACRPLSEFHLFYVGASESQKGTSDTQVYIKDDYR